MTRALLVDDKPENLYMLRMLMQGHGFEVEEALNGVEALIKARHKRPELIISDLLMPEMDGYTLLREWKADAGLREIPFVVYTATYTEPNDERLALELGADAFIVKPQEPEALMKRVFEVVDATRRIAWPARKPVAGEEVTLRLYNEVLVRQLEKKSEQLERRIEELTRSDASLKRLNRIYAALTETNQAIVHSKSRDVLFSNLCRIAVERGGFAVAWVGTMDAASGKAVPIASFGAEPAWLTQHIDELYELVPGQSPIEIALNEGRICLYTDADTDAALKPIQEGLRRRGLHSAVAYPLRIGPHVVAALKLYSAEKEHFDDQLQALVTGMAFDVSFALEVYEMEEVRREAEEELSQLSAELSRRVESRTSELQAAYRELETFSYSVSHDLRSPLSTIHGFTSMVLKKNTDKLDAGSISMLERVKTSAERMAQLIDELLRLSGVSRQELHLQEVDLSEVACRVVDALRQADPGRQIEVRVAPGLRQVADPGLVRIVLDNLLGNAWKYTGRTERPVVDFSAERMGSQNVYVVRDNGAGFDMQHAGKLFRPFQRLHGAEEFAGSGIGLSIVERIVTRHGGRIWAESTPGQGAVFRFTLSA